VVTKCVMWMTSVLRYLHTTYFINFATYYAKLLKVTKICKTLPFWHWIKSVLFISLERHTQMHMRACKVFKTNTNFPLNLCATAQYYLMKNIIFRVPYPNAELFSSPLPSVHSSRIYVKNTQSALRWCVYAVLQMNLAVILNGSFSQLILYFHISRTRLQRHERHWIFCVVINERFYNHGVQGFHKRMVGSESSTEENPVREKEQNILY